jgi:hypothetical protein
MNLHELFEYILESGCGVNPMTYKQSEEYKNLFNKQKTLFERYTKDSDQGTMLRAGNFMSSALLNTKSESEALFLAQSEKSIFGHGVEERAIMHYMGQEILRVAKEQLPKEALILAEKWPLSSAEEQVEITKNIYNLFVCDSQRNNKEMSMENLHSIVIKDRENNIKYSGPTSCLPLLYGAWNENNLANCQGKSQMIIAFANIVGANVLLMNPNDTSADIIEKQRMISREKVLQDIKSRKMVFPDEPYMDSLKAAQIKSEMKVKEDAFHLCPVIQVSDGRWVMIDSNALCWGILSEKWEMDRIYPLLKKYEDVLPGVCLYSNDNEQKNKTIQKIWNRFDEYLTHSKNVESLIGSMDDMVEMVTAFANSDELDFLLKSSVNFHQSSALNAEMREYFATSFLFGEANDFLHNFMDDPKNYLQKKKESLYTFYHCLAGDMINNDWNENGELIHPEGSFFSSVAYNLAISVVNSVALDFNVRVNDSFLPEYSCCPTTMHNAIFSRHSSQELMPFMHSITKECLILKDRFND